MNNENYNGWTNYATWRVNLELIDGIDWKEEGTFESIYALSEYLKERVEDIITNYGELEAGNASYAVDYALAFVNDVNYYEIAQKIAGDYPNLVKECQHIWGKPKASGLRWCEKCDATKDSDGGIIN